MQFLLTLPLWLHVTGWFITAVFILVVSYVVSSFIKHERNPRRLDSFDRYVADVDTEIFGASSHERCRRSEAYRRRQQREANLNDREAELEARKREMDLNRRSNELDVNQILDEFDGLRPPGSNL